jgi:hypothetical protein
VSLQKERAKLDQQNLDLRQEQAFLHEQIARWYVRLTYDEFGHCILLCVFCWQIVQFTFGIVGCRPRGVVQIDLLAGCADVQMFKT